MLSWEAITAIAELVGAVAVVVSLVYLAVQIRQSGKIGRLAAHQGVSDSISAAVEPFYSDDEMSRIWNLAATDPERLSPAEQERFGIALYLIFGKFYNAYLLAEIDPVLSQRYIQLMDRLLVRRGVQQWWGRQRVHFDPEYAAVVQARLDAINASVTPASQSSHSPGADVVN